MNTPGSVRDHLVGVARQIVNLPAADLPVAGLSAVLADTLTVGIGGAAGSLATSLRSELATGSGGSRIWGTARSTDAGNAALLNGVAAHALELDDIYAPGTVHPGAVVVPAAMAVADEINASGDLLARAVVVGYEVCGRLAADLGPSHYRAWHTTGTAGAVGAAAAAATVLGANDDQLGRSLALAATMASGLQQTFRSDASGKPLHAGHAAMAGVIAARAARAGLGGPHDIFDASSGMGAAMGGDGTWAWSTAPLAGYVVDDTTVKPYPCCGHSFAAIDGALEAYTGGVRLDQIVSVRVDTYRAGVEVAGIARPGSAAETRFSIPFLVSLALTDGAVTASELSVARLADPGFSRLVDAVTVHLDPDLEAAFPLQRGAVTTISLTTGETVTVRVPDRRGSSANPMTAQQRVDKFAGLIGRAPAERLRQQVDGLSRLSSVHELDLPVPTAAFGGTP